MYGTVQTVRIKTITESDFDSIVESAGGHRAFATSGSDDPPNADYLLDETVVELKLLEEDGLEKKLRQAKAAALFERSQPGRPVIVLDPDRLSLEDKRRYDRLLESPVKNAISTAN